ncbi:hypothetical protein GRS96_20365 (plasmid) [Rathayibacter sp. VKM Ac-2803]|uniref:hypothetical protein n=1 Tax=Rathayibacter sp. VKM Ac-2803 TaxID=2609256 RepID=UPI00135B5EE2|nr:hypothetical protein [Rathayibacter sp. VKM Ac-2803]MWV51622.1 hypothetical protein [Rathayibacter sp. VKM Ac-2803]
MSTSSVRLLAGRFETDLDSTLKIVPAGPVVITVSGARSLNADLDGKPVRLSGSSVKLLSVDLTRSTGFHRLTVDGETYWFGTEDAKLGLQGIEAMLRELGTLGTGWTGQALFSDGSGLRDPHVVYGWLDQWADVALGAIDAILVSPRLASKSSRVLRRRGGGGVLVAPTVRLLRSDPHRYLAPVPAGEGVITVDGVSFSPLRVVARRRVKTLDTIANRRAVAVLSWIDALARDVVDASPNATAIARARLWSNRARSMHRRPLAQALAGSLIPDSPRQAEEVTEPAYGRSYAVSLDLRARFGWSATLSPHNRLSYVDHSDAIYQAYAATRLARVFGLMQTSAVLGAQQPAFSGAAFDLYYDTRPAKSVLRSWRSHSILPDDSRPDLLLHERETGKVAVLDAKYRRGPDGFASEDSRKDVSAYMALYGVDAVSILYPGKTSASRTIEGSGKRIIELSVSPRDADTPDLEMLVRSSLQLPVY